jgi:hypothetical protein
MTLTENNLDEIIEKIWIKNIKKDFQNRDILFYEATLVAAFYHHLRPIIDEYDDLKLYLEHQPLDLEEKRRPKMSFDLVIMKSYRKADWKRQKHWELDYDFHYWARFEFKFNKKLVKEQVAKDISKLRDMKDNYTKRAYFFSIDEEYKGEPFLSLLKNNNNWFKDFYREGRAKRINENEWDFIFINPDNL